MKPVTLIKVKSIRDFFLGTKNIESSKISKVKCIILKLNDWICKFTNYGLIH